MNLYLTTVAQKKKKSGDVPGILFYAEWTKPMGFIPDALVQFIPEDGGAQFRLCNENIASYSALVQQTTGLGGVFVHVGMHRHREYPCLAVSGEVVTRTGLDFGDNLIAKFSYGLVHLRKLPHKNAKIIIDGRISGKWLIEPGFEHESVITVDSTPGFITCFLQEDGLARTAELVKYARANKLNLLQVHKVAESGGITPLIEIPHSRFTQAGLSPDVPILAVYEYGRLIFQKLDLVALGF